MIVVLDRATNRFDAAVKELFTKSNVDLSRTYPGQKTNPSLFGFDERSQKLELRVHSHPNDKEEFVTKSNLELCSFDLTKHSHYEDIQLIAKQNPQLRNKF